MKEHTTFIFVSSECCIVPANDVLIICGRHACLAARSQGACVYFMFLVCSGDPSFLFDSG